MARPKLARDIMVTKLVTLTPTTHVFDAIARLLKHNLTGAPVIDQHRNYLGVFSEKCSMRVLTATARMASEENVKSRHLPRAKEVMAAELVTLTPDMDVFDAISFLLKRRVSGAPVIDENRAFLGVFSEKTSMTVLLSTAYEQLPTSRVEAFMDTDKSRTIAEDIDLLSIAGIFLDTPYRRLPVLREGKLLGQISRRDVLRAAHSVSSCIPSREDALRDWKPDDSAESECGPVSTFMDTAAETIGEDIDLLSIAQIFRRTPYRRLPVLDQGKLEGQISRRDLLKAINDTIGFSPQREKTLLYLSSLVDRSDVPF